MNKRHHLAIYLTDLENRRLEWAKKTLGACRAGLVHSYVIEGIERAVEAAEIFSGAKCPHEKEGA